ncbi:hypothetical protein BGZ65_003420, partial [Modicella reniformis]
MAPQNDIHITWPHSVPSGKAFIAGTWPVPGHEQWEKLPMTRIPDTDAFEIRLDIQEIEDISGFVDEDGYFHHALADCHDPSAPSPSASPAKRSKRERIKRFLGRGRSSSTSTSTSNHLDLPYHHQSKDGIIIPLTHTYKYQYKFVIDEVWQCDPSRPLVQDSEGNWNHELVVELVEQIRHPPSPSNRSRSSSIQSQQSAQVSQTTTTATTTTTTSNNTPETTTIVEDKGHPVIKIETETPATTSSSLPLSDAAEVPSTPPAAAAAAVDHSLSPAIPSTPSQKSKDTYEAVRIFETEDLSDGDGRRSRRRKNVITDDDHHQDASKNNLLGNNNKRDEQEIIGHPAEESNVVAPQQHQPH